LGISKEDVASIPNDILSSIFFSDDALSTFFKEYSKRDDFKNTIFIITGDHAIDLNLTDNALENFHVPLIIYSPLLIKASNFRGACSHIDILPSLAVLLKQNYGLDVASKIHWIGKGLDTSSSKVFDRIIPLKLTSIEMPNFIYNNNVLLNNKVMKLNAHLLLTEELSINNKNKINELYENYKLINNYVCSQDRIWYKEK
jgi:phosphoglycerol transferase MdoB-like AlkP superfamily enzyme